MISDPPFDLTARYSPAEISVDLLCKVKLFWIQQRARLSFKLV